MSGYVKNYFIAVLHNHNITELRRRLTEPFSVLVILMKKWIGHSKEYLEFLPTGQAMGK